MNRPRLSLLGAALVAAALPLGVASAQLGFASAGAVNPANGFPQNYVDTTGVSLDACLTDPIFCGLTVPVATPQPGVAFPANYGGTFPSEFFFNRCVAKMTVNGGGVANLAIALEGAFLNGAVADQQQMVFGRVRLRVTAGLVPNATYNITTPVGVFTIVADGNGRINMTDDIGLIPLDFTGPLSALHSHVGPFLRWDTGLPLFDAAGREYIGTPALDHTITGSPAGTNFFRIDGQAVGGAGVNRVQTNLFAVTGLKTPVVQPPAPVANFSSAPNSGTAPLTVAFTDLSTGTITSRSWTFGDGGTSTLTNPSHIYTSAGTFSVSLTVVGPGGTSTLNKPNLVVVTGAPPPPGLTLAQPVPGTAGVANTLVCTGARPGSTVGFFSSQALGASVVNNGHCPLGIPIGLGSPFRNMGTAKANGAGVATFVTTPPPSSRGKLFHFQAVEPASCSASNVVHDVL